MKISLCMIVKDEEETLARCLGSVRDCVDEIVIVDTGSADKTVEIAKKYADVLGFYRWQDDFSAARNYSLSLGTGDYLFWLDADDYLPPDEAKKFLRLREMLAREEPDLVSLPYVLAADENGEPTYFFLRERLFKRSAGLRFEGRIHECVAPRGKRAEFGARVYHLGSGKDRGMRNLLVYLKQIEAGEPLSPRDLFYYGRELSAHGLRREAIAVLEDFLSGSGWYVNKIEACKILGQCYANLGYAERSRLAYLRGFLYGEPRAALCYALGESFKRERKFPEAVCWFEAAISCSDHSAEGDFEEPCLRTVSPMLELVVCYEALGKRERALFYHKKTEEVAPSHPSVLRNREYFKLT